MKFIKQMMWLVTLFITSLTVQGQWTNPDATIDERVEDLLSKMTLDEKISYCGSVIPGIERLDIPDFEWYGEALHGVIGWNCTQFPQNIAMGSTWNPDLMFDVATAISNEVRALKNMGKKEVMMFSPTVNMARDPRWGRNGECYSEDPFLMSEMARMYVRGMEGNDSKYIKAVTTVKHYVANNVDKGRERIHSNIGKKDLYEYYFPAYKTCVIDEEASGIMTALNGLNGIPCSAHNWLVNDVLRDEWGFQGYVIADWTAVEGIEKNMKYASSQPEAAAMAIKAGVDQECFRRRLEKFAPMVYALKPAIEQGLISEEELNVSVRRLLKLRFRTGDFDDASLNPYSEIPTSVLECDAHRSLALKAAEEAIVLLKNEAILPLKKDIENLAVIGPFANRCWMGIYSGHPKNKISPLSGIENYTDANVRFAEGCSVIGAEDDQVKIDQAVALAKKSEYVVLVVGNDESTSTENLDRKSLQLPGNQHRLIKAVQAVNKNVVLVLVPSGPTAINWEQENIPGIICAWPNGQEQGTALANVLFGKVNPGGKLNSTWYKSVDDLPDFNDYKIREGKRTYMYFDGSPLYPFGFGLSYTNFEIKNVQLSTKKLKAKKDLFVSATIENTGLIDGDEVVQVYIRDVKSSEITPIKSLKGFKKVHVKSGESEVVKIKIPFEAFARYDVEKEKFIVEKGDFEILVGNSSDRIVAIKKITVKSGEIAPIRVGQKSGYYDSEDANRDKKWNHIYKNEADKKTTQASEKSMNDWVSYRFVFTDPGFYVNTWDTEIVFDSVSKGAEIETSMQGAKIKSYKAPKDLKLSVKIPIPPEYGKPVELKITTLKGSAKVKSIKIIPPGDKEAFIVSEVYKSSKS